MSPADSNSAQPQLQLRVVESSLHLWAIDPTTGETLGAGELIHLVDRELGRDITGAGTPARASIPFPEPLGARSVSTLRLPFSALGDMRIATNAAHRLSPSVRWFRTADRLAKAVVNAGRVRPHLVINGPAHLAMWSVVTSESIESAIAALAGACPPACGLVTGPAGVDAVADFVDLLVDAGARRRLGDEAWRPAPPLRARGPEYRAAQATFRALGSGSGSVLYRTEDIGALEDLGDVFVDEMDRAHGFPVIVPQLRLHLPDGPDAPWLLTLELVDADHPERWCTANDVLARTPLAVDLANEERHLERLVDRLIDAAAFLGGEMPEAEPLRTNPAAELEFDIPAVEAFLATWPPQLEELGYRLLGPEQLIKAKAGVRGAASPRPEAPSRGRFNAGALVDWSATVDDSPVDEAQLERAAATGTSLIHVGGRWVRLDATQVRNTLERLQRHRVDHSDLDAAALVRLAVDQEGTPTELRGEGWVEDLLAGLPDERLVEEREPEGFVGELRHYQRRGLSWMSFLGRLGLGGCLADDMGLGKTATTLAHLAQRPGPHLVVCPLSVVHNWYAEAARFTPQLQVLIHHGNERVRGDTAAAQLIPADVIITTYGLLARDIDALAEVRWGTLVLDEAQAVKNHLTKAAKAVRLVRADQRIALTGTPVENHLGELWSILDAVNPGLYGSATSFNEKYSKPIQRSQDPVATAALRTLTQPFVLRRTKADKTLLPELPDKIEQVAWATLTREQAAMYQAVVDQLLADAQAAAGMKRRGLVLAALTRLKQICNHPAHANGDGSRLSGRSGKLTRFDEIIDDMLEVGERALVFTQFREMGTLLQRHLAERLQIDAPFLHGGVTRQGRQKMVDDFQAGTGAPILLVSLKAGGTGLNLTAASQVIHYDRWWNPAVEDQATDRAWRLGQTRTVLVHKLVCEGTLEERIGQLIDDKKQLATSVLGTGEAWLTELSTDDLRSLVAFTPGQGLGK